MYLSHPIHLIPAASIIQPPKYSNEKYIIEVILGFDFSLIQLFISQFVTLKNRKLAMLIINVSRLLLCSMLQFREFQGNGTVVCLNWFNIVCMSECYVVSIFSLSREFLIFPGLYRERQGHNILCSIANCCDYVLHYLLFTE